MNFAARLERWIAPLKRRVDGMIGMAVLKALDDAPALQVLKVALHGETHAGVARIQNFGFTSAPPAGAQALVLFVGGRRDNPLVVALDDGRVRPKLESGEAMLYNASGAVIHLQAGGKVAIGNGAVELLDLLDQALGALASATVPAPGGPYTLSSAATLTSLRTQLAGLKGSL